MAMPVWVRNVLREQGIAYEEMHHRCAFTAQQVAAAEHVSGHRLIKVVVVMADGKPVELLLPATCRVQMERVRRILGAREIRLASEREMENFFPECDIGAIPPVVQTPGVEMIMDPTLQADGDIFMQAGTHEDALRMNFRDWYGLTRPRIAPFAEVLH